MGNKGMTTLKNKPLLAIIAVGIATALAAVVFSVQSAAHAQEAFGGSGYVLQVEDTQVQEGAEAGEQGADSSQAVEPLVAPISFAENATYRHRFPDTVQFTDVEGEKTTVSQKSFVHYDDKSIAAFVKTVFVDLDHVNDPVVYYYDLPAGRTMEFEGGSWRLDNGGSELSFAHVLMKLDEAHYLVLSDDITFSVNGETQQNFKGAGSYLEVEYIEGGIVRFSNDQGSYQTIASDATVAVGNGVSVNFGDKLVSTEDGAKLSLDQMVIDADDNIQISPEAAAALAGGEEGEEGAEGEAGAEGGAAGGTTVIGGGSASAGGGAGGSSSSSSGAVAGGVAGDGTQGDAATDGDDGEDGEEEDGGDVLEDTNDSRKTPTFSISDGSTSPVGFNANISITDEENMLSSGTTVTIVDRETGKVVYESSVAAGVLDFDISAAGLDPDKEYVLSATATYKDGDQEYTKSFLDKVFKTDPVGIMMNKAYAATDALGINVQVGAYANVVNAKLRLLNDKGEQVETKDIDVSGARVEGGVDVSFENLTSNSVYAAELCDVTYSNVTVDSFGDALALKTLRRAPELPVPVSTPDRKANQFYLELPSKDIKDPDGGIDGYKWEVYNASDVRSGLTGEPVFAGSPVWTAEPVDGTKVTLPVDNLTIMNGGRYVARVLVSFDDNEKIVTYDTSFTTPPFGMDGVAFPSIRLEENKEVEGEPDGPITFESYHGTLYIDNASAIVSDSEIKVVYRDDIGNKSEVITYNVTDDNTDTIVIPLDLYNLRKSAMYTVQVYAKYNLGDGNPAVTGYIGAARFSTLAPDTIEAKMDYLGGASTPFLVSLHLQEPQQESEARTGNIELEMKTMSSLNLKLHRGNEAGDVIAEATLYGNTTNTNEGRYSSTLYESLYEGTANLTPKDFKIDDTLIKAGEEYTITVGKAYDYTLNKNQDGRDVPNELPVVGKLSFTTNKTWPALPDDPADGVDVIEITNENAQQILGDDYPYNPSLDPETVLGYQVKSTFKNGNNIARELTYNMYDEGSGSNKPILSHTEAIKDNGDIPTWTVLFGKGEAREVLRGHKYRFDYTMKIQLKNGGEDEEVLTYPECATSDPNYRLTSDLLSAPRQLAKTSMYLEDRVSTDEGDKAIWKWVTHDPDDTLNPDRKGHDKAYLEHQQGKDKPAPLPLRWDGGDGWNTIEASFVENETYTLTLCQNPYDYNASGDIVKTELVTHYVEAERVWSTGESPAEGSDEPAPEFTEVTWHESDKPGGLIVEVASSLDSSALSAVAALEITFDSGSDSKTIYAAPTVLGSGPCILQAEVALADISELLGSNLTVRAKVVYDTGDFGIVDDGSSLDADDLFAFQEVSEDKMLKGKYAIFVDGGAYKYAISSELTGGAYRLKGDFPAFDAATAFKELVGNATNLTFDVLGGKRGATANISSSEGGILLTDTAGVAGGKAVAVKHLTQTSGKALVADDKYSFDIIPPIANVLDPVSGIDRAQVTFTPELVGMASKDNALKVKLQKKNPDQSWADSETTWFTYKNVFTNGNSQTITIPQGVEDDGSLGLDPSCDYRFYLYVDAYIVKQPGNVQKDVSVIDKATGEEEHAYYIKLDKDMKVSVKDMDIVPDKDDPYLTKALNISYELDRQMGFVTKVEVFGIDEMGNVSDTPLLSGTKDVNAEKDVFSFNFGPKDPNATKLELGKDYAVRVSCYTAGSGADPMLLGSDQKTFTLGKLGKPTTSITARPLFEQIVDEEEQKKVNDAARAAEEQRKQKLAEEAARALEREVSASNAAETPDQTADPSTDSQAAPAADSTDAPHDAGEGMGDSTDSSGVEPTSDTAEESEDQETSSDEWQSREVLRNKYDLEFNINVFDLEGSLVDGKYMVRFMTDRYQPIETSYDTVVYNISDKNQVFKLENLKPDSSYIVEVYGVIDEGNTGELPNIEDVFKGAGSNPDEVKKALSEHVIASGSGKTTPSSGVEVGVVQLSQRVDHPNQFTMNFYGSLNLGNVDKVKLTVYSTNAVVHNGVVEFALTPHGPEGNPTHYSFNPGVELTETGMYTAQVVYMSDSGETLATGTYEYIHIATGKGR